MHVFLGNDTFSEVSNEVDVCHVRARIQITQIGQDQSTHTLGRVRRVQLVDLDQDLQIATVAVKVPLLDVQFVGRTMKPRHQNIQFIDDSVFRSNAQAIVYVGGIPDETLRRIPRETSRRAHLCECVRLVQITIVHIHLSIS